MSAPVRQYKYFEWVLVGFVTVYLCANIIGVVKATQIGKFTFAAGDVFFPLSYIFGDILTEVYGYAKSRRVIWAGMFAMTYASIVSFVIVALPPASDWTHQRELEIILGATPRIAAASIIAYFLGEFTNSYVLAKIKVWMKGRLLWVRTIGSTIVGQIVDSSVFYPLAFWGIWPGALITKVILGTYLIKVAVEVLFTPLTYVIVNFLKKAEHEDYYDRNTNFNPFLINKQ